MTDTIEEKIDGRTARRLGTRDVMLRAGLKYMERTGNYRPQMLDITKRTRIHPRTFHVIFGSMEGYFDALINEHEASVREMIKRDVSEKNKSLTQLVLRGR